MNNAAEAGTPSTDRSTVGMSSIGKFAWAMIALLAILHYDFWNWSDRSLMFGFMPSGLFYQAMISIGAAVAWAMIVKFAWPTHIEEWADAPTASTAADDSADEQVGNE
ncbi:MAG: hypothetical protein ACI85K_002436 [Hyphomicrobiaceae bacterium]|jgi:hypothetical protein